jgi:hypothetical protein
VEVKPKDPNDPAAKDPAPAKPTPPAKPKPKPPTGPRGTLTGPAWPDAIRIYDAILAGGKEGVAHVIDLIGENDFGPAYKPRYVLHGLALYACRPGNEKHRAAVTGALVEQMTGPKPKSIRAYLVRTLHVCGEPAHAAALAPLLTDDELADPALAAITALGGDAAKHLAAALPGATGSAKLGIVQALGALRDVSAVDALLPLADDADENLRLAAVWSLARSGDARAIGPVTRATDAKEPWARAQATKSAFVLAEGLAAAGRKPEAARVYQHLVDTREPELEKHVVGAARQGLAASK